MVKTGDIIWAKLRGYPWWPGEVVKNERLPKAIKSTDTDSIPVYFFGSRDYALINNDSIKSFDEENWKLFKNKSSAPKFKSALAEARKKARGSQSFVGKEKLDAEPPNKTETFAVKKKRGRPRKLKLVEARKRLQQLLFSNNSSCVEEVKIILSRIVGANELDKEEIDSSKIGVLLKTVFCSDEFKFWQENEEVLLLVNRVAVKLINSK